MILNVTIDDQTLPIEVSESFIQEAEGYRDATIALATGEADRFSLLREEYAKAPDVTRKRMYLETMESILPEVEKIIIEPGTTQVLPYLPLGRSQAGGQP